MKLKANTLMAAVLCGLSLPSAILADEEGRKPKAGHDHEHEITGPNQGRMILTVEPHAEFFVTKDRKVQITFVDDHGKKIPAKEQTVSIICGNRSNPTMLKMEIRDGSLISDKTLPDGKSFPTVVSFKMTPAGKTVREKFNLDLNACPTCDFEEYRCTCDHEHPGE